MNKAAVFFAGGVLLGGVLGFAARSIAPPPASVFQLQISDDGPLVLNTLNGDLKMLTDDQACLGRWSKDYRIECPPTEPRHWQGERPAPTVSERGPRAPAPAPRL